MERIPAMTLFGLTIPTGLNTYLICSAIALVLGIPTALCYTVRNTRYSKSFAFALFALPFAVTTVLMMVGNQIGAAVTISLPSTVSAPPLPHAGLLFTVTETPDFVSILTI